MSNLKKLEEMLLQGKITRREFLAKISALGLTAALSPALLSTLGRAATPKKGGRLRIGVHDFSISDSLDPTSVTSNSIYLLTYQLRNNLIEEGPGGNLIPELAESWEPSSDLKKWTFRLRKGVEFHNGKTFDAEDVIFSINLHRGEESKSGAKPLVSPIKEIRPDGKHTVIFTLEAGNVGFPAIMTVPLLPIVSAGTTDFDKGIGTGPYILKSLEMGVKSLAKRNPNYWKEGRGHFDEVEMSSISDVTARTSALLTGKIDAMSFCDLKTVHLLGKKADIQILRTTSKQHYLFSMRTDLAPYDNNDVRMALKYAIDRESVIKTILRGYGTVGNDHPISSSYRFYASEMPQREYDPDKAKFHLKKAGAEDYTFELHAADVPFAGAVDAAILYQQYAAKAGIKMKVVREPEDGYWANVWGKKPWFTAKWNGRPTEDIMFSTAYVSDAAWNETHWKNERFDKLLMGSRTEIDEARRREMYVEMLRLVRDEGGAVIPVFADYVDAASSKVKFGTLLSSYELDGCKCAERWWFEP